MSRRIFSLDAMLALIFLYALMPTFVAYKLAYNRVLGMPASYLPILALLGLFFMKAMLDVVVRHRLLFNKPVMYLFMFLLYLPVQYILLVQSELGVDTRSFMADYAMFLFYAIVVYYGATLYFHNIKDGLLKLEAVLEKFMGVLFVICLIAPVRHALFDRNAVFFNIFNPLPYRLFEVLFLIFFSALAVGWYYGTGKKKYMYYFAAYSFCIILSGSRTAYGAFAIILAYLILRKRFILSFKGVALAVILVSGLYVGGDQVMHRISKMQDISYFLKLDLEGGVEEKASVRRLTHTISSIEMVKMSPLIGIGLGKENLIRNFPQYLMENVSSIARPHNFYLNLVQSTGAVGFLIFTMFFYSTAAFGYRTFRHPGLSPELKEKNLHMFFAMALILVIQVGYEFETEPFLWLFWGFIYSYFHLSRQAAMEGVQT